MNRTYVRETTITLPMPPSVNNLYQGMGKNRRKSTGYSAWFGEAGWRLNEARAKRLCGNLKPDSWYWTDIRLPQNHLGDTDNRLKAVHDLLHQMHLTPDDKWLLGGTYMRCPHVEPGTCVVSVASMDCSNLNHWQQIRLIAERMIAADAALPKSAGTSFVEHRGVVG